MQLKRVQPAGGRAVRGAFLLSLIVMLFAVPAQATKYAGAFMENGGGARALGMGGAFTAVADDPSATFWNPAGLATIGEREILLMHSERFGDLIDRDFVSYTQPVSWNILGGSSSGIGLSVIRLGIDDIPFTNDELADYLDLDENGLISPDEYHRLLDPEAQDLIELKSDQEFALMFSYGETLGAWQMGATVKFIHQSIGKFSSMGVGADLAMLRPQVWRRLDFGIKFQDLTTTYLSWSTGRNELITPAIVPGLAWRQPLPDWNMDFTLAGSLETRFDHRGDADQFDAGAYSANSHLGLEVGFSRKVFLRTGYDSGFDAGNVTAGVGFRIDPLTVDYAYAGDSLDIDEVTHRISLSFRF